MLKPLIQRENSLPFEAQNHCKLKAEEIQDIRIRYENGEKISHIHLDYPQVSWAAIKYWASEENRQNDLERRKQDESYFVLREKHDEEYMKDYYQRRADNNLPAYKVINFGKNNVTPLTKEQIKTIRNLYEGGNSALEIQKITGIKRTKIQSYFDNIDPIWYHLTKGRNKRKKWKIWDNICKDKQDGMSNKELVQKYNINYSYLTSILAKRGITKKLKNEIK